MVILRELKLHRLGRLEWFSLHSIHQGGWIFARGTHFYVWAVNLYFWQIGWLRKGAEL